MDFDDLLDNEFGTLWDDRINEEYDWFLEGDDGYNRFYANHRQ